jgi:hypothetical protein
VLCECRNRGIGQRSFYYVRNFDSVTPSARLLNR